MPSPRERDHRGTSAGTPRSDEPRSDLVRTVLLPRRYHFHDRPPWPHQHHHDYISVDGWGWWPRWYPYADPRWYAYWWQLYDYYGGDAYPEYAEYARDAVLRANASQLGLAVSGEYGNPLVGIQPYGVSPAQGSQRGRPDQAAAYRSHALEVSRRTFGATGSMLFGYRDSPWGSELTAFGTRAGLQRWSSEQTGDPDVWYAVAFDLGTSASPLAEVVR